MPKKKKKGKSSAPRQIIFEVKPYGIHSLQKFLNEKIENAKRVSEGTQTTETFTAQNL